MLNKYFKYEHIFILTLFHISLHEVGFVNLLGSLLTDCMNWPLAKPLNM